VRWAPQRRAVWSVPQRLAAWSVPPQPELLQAHLSPVVLQAHLSPAELSALQRREAAVLPDAEAAFPARRHAAVVLQGFRHLGASWTEALSVSAELAPQLERELSAPASWPALAVAWRRSAEAAAERVRPSEVRVAGSAQRAAWALPAASLRPEEREEPAERRSAEAAGASAQAVPLLAVAAYAELAPRQGAAQRPEEAASDVEAAPQRAAEAAGSDAEVAPQRVAEAAGSDAEAEPQRVVGAARLDAAGGQQRAAEVAELDAPAEPRQAAALWDVRGRQRAAARPLAAPSVYRRDRALPGPAPRRAVRFAHSKRRMLRAASLSKRSWQAARDEGLSY
jgi:hypothetical protein